MRIIPDAASARLLEDNDCHNPAGSPASSGGEFCSKRLTLKQRKAQRAKGISQMKVAAGGVTAEKEQKRLRTLAKGRETQRVTRLRNETTEEKGDMQGFYDALDKVAQRHPLLDREVILGGNVIADLQNVELADTHGVTLRLTASPLRITRGPVSKTSKPKLIAFYKRFGFTPDPIYTRSSGAMIRKPKPT